MNISVSGLFHPTLSNIPQVIRKKHLDFWSLPFDNFSDHNSSPIAPRCYDTYLFAKYTNKCKSKLMNQFIELCLENEVSELMYLLTVVTISPCLLYSQITENKVLRRDKPISKEYSDLLKQKLIRNVRYKCYLGEIKAI